MITQEQLNLECSLLEAELEGLFRQCYQACTQQSFKHNLAKYRRMVDKVSSLVDNMEEFIQQFIIEEGELS